MSTETRLFIDEKRDEPEKLVLPEEKPRRLLLEHTGIIDLNSFFSLLPEDMTAKFGIFPNISPDIYSFINWDLKTTVTQEAQLQTIRLPYPNSDQFMYPIAAGKLISSVIETELFRRLFGISQLCLRSDYPFQNDHSRGHHSIYVAVNMVRTLQTVSEKTPELLEKRLREDFSGETFYRPNITREDLFNLAADLAVLAGLEHDQATPAGGDAVKIFTGLDEEQDIGWLFFGGHSILQRELAEFKNVLLRHGLSDGHLKFVVDCIQGKSNSLIGSMIHPKEGDCLDWDRVGYTLLDAQIAGLLSPQLPTKLLPEQLDKIQEMALKTVVENLITLAEIPDYIEIFGISSRNRETGIVYGRPSVSFIDPSEDFILDDRGDLVNTRPEKIAWIAAIRAAMTIHYYMGNGMLGYESELHHELGRLSNSGLIPGLLSRENLISITNSELARKLSQLSPVILNLLGGEHLEVPVQSIYHGYIGDKPKTTGEEAYKLKIKPGLGTKVSDGGELVTLEEYLRKNPDNQAAVMIKQITEKCTDKKRIVSIAPAESDSRRFIFLG